MNILMILLATQQLSARNINFDDVYENIIEQHQCLICHNSSYHYTAAGLDLYYPNAYESLVNHQATQSLKKRVEPGDPENSYLLKKLRGDRDIQGLRMPRGQTPVPEAKLEMLIEWINSGALN